GRADGEVVSLMRRGLARATRAAEVFETRGEFRAIEAGLRLLKSGDLILIQADQVQEAIRFVEQHISGTRESAGGMGVAGGGEPGGPAERAGSNPAATDNAAFRPGYRGT
ncbi:MAG: hypothetical protein ACKOJF_11435, partial [Planctomycetaceae bacterium]